MSSIMRLKTGKETILLLFNVCYMMFAVPFLVFLGVVAIYMWVSASPYHRDTGLPLFTTLVWLGVVVPSVIYVKGVRSKSALLKSLASTLKNGEFFKPSVENEFFQIGGGKYFGIDQSNGTILYIHRIRKGQVDVIGLTMGDWTNRELEGNVLRLYTKFPELPRIEITTPWAQRWYDMLGAMEYKRYSTPKPFPEYVRDHVAQLERENHIHIPQVV